MKILVTGGNGFIGSQVLRALVARGDEVIALLRPDASRRRIEDLLSSIQVEEASLDDSAKVASVLALVRPTVVIHLAWYAQPADYLSSVENLRSLASTCSLAERAFALGCRKFVGVGSGLEYAPRDVARREHDPAEPWSLYGACKLAASQVVARLGAMSSAEVVWARLFHVHGPAEDPARLLPSIARSLADGRPMDLSPGLQVRDHLHVADVAGALVCLTEAGLTGVYNVCSGVAVTLKDVASAIGETFGRPELLRFGALPAAPPEIRFLVGDSTRLRKAGWVPIHTDLKASLADAVRAYLRGS